MKGWSDEGKCGRWVSAQITEASITSGTSQSITLSAFPAAVIPISAYIIADEAATSGNGSTTTLTYALGVSGLTQGYLTAGANVLTSAGRQANGTGVLLGGYRHADALLLTITAGGGAPDVAHLTNLAVRVVVDYRLP